MDLHILNKEQKIAVQHQKGPLLVLSGAGTGKTRVLTSRFVYIVESLNIDFNKIIAVAFKIFDIFCILFQSLLATWVEIP